MLTPETAMNPISTNRWTLWDLLKYYLSVYTVALPHFLSFLFFAQPLAFVSFFVFTILPEWPAKEKASYRKKKLFFFGDSRVNITRRLTVVNFPTCTDWLSYLRTQLKMFAGGVCLRSRRFFWALFSRISFFAWSTQINEFELKGNLFNCPQNKT